MINLNQNEIFVFSKKCTLDHPEGELKTKTAQNEHWKIHGLENYA